MTSVDKIAAGSAGAGVGSDECPMEDGAIAMDDHIVQEHLKIGKRSHELLRSLSDGVAQFMEISRRID